MQTIRTSIDKAEFDRVRDCHKSIHVYTQGQYTVRQHYTMRSELPVVEEWYDRDTQARTYKTLVVSK